MFDHENQFEYTDYCSDVINQCKEHHEKLQQKYDELYDIYDSYYKNAATLKEDHQKLKQDYQNLYDECNNYYQAYVFSDYSST